MFGWDQWKKGFERWENSTAQYLEQVLKSPAVLVPAGAALTVGMRAKAAVDAGDGLVLAAVRLPTRRDQERALHRSTSCRAGSSTSKRRSKIRAQQKQQAATKASKAKGASHRWTSRRTSRS
jgi:hypothetical protein